MGTQLAEAQQGTGERLFDVILASYGGNDLGFESVMFDCIGFDDAAAGVVGGAYLGGWAGAFTSGAAGLWFGGCRPGLEEYLRAEIDKLARNELPKLYNEFARATAPGALIVVTGYPQLFEDPATRWYPEAFVTRRCHGVHKNDAAMLRGVQARFNEVLGQQVAAASKRHPDRTWVFADVSVRFHGKGLCNRDRDEWLNGVTTSTFSGEFRKDRSFHPNQFGHTFGYTHAISRMKAVNDWKPRPRALPSDGSDAIAFFRSTEDICLEHARRTFNSELEPIRFSGATPVRETSPNVWLIVDGLGDELLVDLNDRTVYSTDGPEAELPRMYSFACPPELYPGTADA